MTDAISAVGVDLINDYMKHAIGVFAFAGALIYLLVQHKSDAAKSVAFVGFVGWAMMCGAIPVCAAFMAAAFLPKLLLALQDYSLAPALYGVYYAYCTIWETVIPKLREYFASRK